MPWVVDSCVLLDIALNDAEFASASANMLDRLALDEIVACPVTIVELAPCFGGSQERIRTFLEQIGISGVWGWTADDTKAAVEAWARHIAFKQGGQERRRPLADILIGAFALRVGGLVTRNARHFSSVFPDLKISVPVGE